MTPSGDAPAFYTRLPAIRAELSISRNELAKAVGVHYQTIGYIERCEYSPSLNLVLQIAAHVDQPVEEIFSLRPFDDS